MLSRGARIWLGAAAIAAAAACSTFESEEAGEVIPERDSSTPSDAEVLEAALDAGTADADADADAAVDPVIDLQAGGDVGCALRESGHVTCWGNNGSLGTGQLLDSACEQATRCRPAAQVPNLEDIVQISVGLGFACARRKDGAVLCWGADTSGTLGAGVAGTARAEALVVPGLPAGAIDVVAGGQTACARVTADGGINVYCWGSNEQVLLAKSGGAINGPTRILALDGAKAVSLSLTSPVACAIRADDRVVCWGRNYGGSLGHFTGAADTNCAGATVCNPTPTLIGDGTLTAMDLAVGYYVGCARRASGLVECWGNNEFGGLGRGPLTNNAERPNPSPVTGLPNATAISGRGEHTCALVGGTPYCWGQNHWGEIGDGSGGVDCSGRLCRSLPVMIGALGSIVQLSAGNKLTLARTTDGRLYSWGANHDARLGHPQGTGNDQFCDGNLRCNPIPTPLVIP